MIDEHDYVRYKYALSQSHIEVKHEFWKNSEKLIELIYRIAIPTHYRGMRSVRPTVDMAFCVIHPF